MGLRIEFSLGADDDETCHSLAFTQGRVIVGRGRGSDVHVPSTSISLQHLAFEHIGGHWTATDLDSTNGSWFAGSRLIPGRPMRIERGGQLQVGTHVLSVALEPVAQGASDAQTKSLARALLRAELAAEGTPCAGPSVLVLSQIGQGERRALAPGQNVLVGRGEDCDLSIPDAELSREHLLVRFDGHMVELIDQGAKNGSRLAGRSFDRTLATSGDHIHIGATTLIIDDPVDDVLQERLQLPDEEVPLARASRVPQPRSSEPASEDVQQSELPERADSGERGNRKISSTPQQGGVEGGERLLFAFALALLLLSLAGLWVLFR